MSQIRTVQVFNDITGKWIKLRTEVAADGQIDLERIATELKNKHASLMNADNLELTKINIPDGVEWIVPVCTNEELEEQKRTRRKMRLSRQLKIQMKY